MHLKNAFSSLANFSVLLPKHQLNDACACGLRVIITAAVMTQAGGMYLQGVGTLNRLSLKPHSDAKQQAVKVVHCHSLSWTRCDFTFLFLRLGAMRESPSSLHSHPYPVQPQRLQARCDNAISFPSAGGIFCRSGLRNCQTSMSFKEEDYDTCIIHKTTPMSFSQ